MPQRGFKYVILNGKKNGGSGWGWVWRLAERTGLNFMFLNIYGDELSGNIGSKEWVKKFYCLIYKSHSVYMCQMCMSWTII